MLPRVFDQQQVHRFKYWRDGVCQGMRHDRALYDHVRTYAVSDRLQAYGLACDLAEQGQQTCVTRAADCYEVWVEMRSLLASTTASEPSGSSIPRRLMGQFAS